MNKLTSLPAEEPVLRVPAMPADTNAGGSMFGGWLMGQLDIAGSIPAVVRAQGRVVTAAVNHMQFRAPLFPGDLVSLYARVSHTGRTSITSTVEAYVQRLHHGQAEVIHVADAEIVFVAIDDKRQPRPLPETA